MEIKKQERYSNIELLRIIAMACVVFLHYYNAGLGGASKYVAQGSSNEFALTILESIGICGVNLFLMISGYFLSRSDKRTIGRAAILLMQTSIFRMCYYLIKCAIVHAPVLKRTLFRMFLPANWFVILYVTLYLISPLLNHALRATNRKKALLWLIALFSIWPSAVDILQQFFGWDLNSLSTIGMDGSQRGYTIVNFFLCYCIGAYLNEIDLTKLKKRYLLLFLVADAAIITIWGWFWDASTAREYCNPLVIAEAAAAVLLFLKLDLGCNKVINRISTASFSVFLLHTWFFPLLKIELYVTGSLWMMLAHIFVSILAIILVAFIIDAFYKLLFGWLNSKLKGLLPYEL